MKSINCVKKIIDNKCLKIENIKVIKVISSKNPKFIYNPKA